MKTWTGKRGIKEKHMKSFGAGEMTVQFTLRVYDRYR